MPDYQLELHPTDHGTELWTLFEDNIAVWEGRESLAQRLLSELNGSRP